MPSTPRFESHFASSLPSSAKMIAPSKPLPLSEPSTAPMEEPRDPHPEISVHSPPTSSDLIPQAPTPLPSSDLIPQAPTPPPSSDLIPQAPTPPPSAPPHLLPSSKGKMEMMRDAVDRLGKRITEAAKLTGDVAGDVWQHLKTAPTVADAAMGIIAQSTKVIAEGGYEKIFRSTFDTVPDEKLKDCFACYLSTSAGPILGVLYLSSAKVAFCSDNALSYKVGDKTEWSYYKVIIPLHQLRAVNPSTSKVNPAEKYIQVVSIDNREFWLMSFLNYDGAVKSLLEAPLAGDTET